MQTTLTPQAPNKPAVGHQERRDAQPLARTETLSFPVDSSIDRREDNQPALIHFDRARRELELACSIDEVKDIRDKAEVMRLYARYVSQCIDNSRLYNEDVLLSGPEYVLITEGAPDVISGIDNDLPAVSPIGTTIKKDDWDRLLPKFSGIKTIYLVGDNEISQVGLESSLKTARLLQSKGVKAKLIILPPDKRASKARKEIEERWGITKILTAREITEKKRELTAEEREEFSRLAEAAKVDLNSWFVNGHTREEFDELLDAAQTPLEFAVSRLTPEDFENGLSDTLNSILESIAQIPSLEWKPLLKAIRSRIDKRHTFGELEKHVREIKKDLQVARQRQAKEKQITATPGTCEHTIQTATLEPSPQYSKKDLYIKLGERVFEWFQENGGIFCTTKTGAPYLIFGGKTY